jgi:Cof subfamily protein (haloacid dehalogenase superfamily)
VAPLFPIRMLALDIDGTLVNETRVIPERTRRVVVAALRAGVRVSLVTGRMPTSALRFAAQMGLVDPIVGYQGAVVREIRGAGDERPGQLLYHEPVSSRGAVAAVRWAMAHGLGAHANHLERFLIQRDDPRLAEYQAFLGGRARPVDDLKKVLERPVSKVTAVGEPPIPESLIGEAQAKLGGLVQPTMSHPRFLEFVAPGVNKGRAVRWLARRQGIPLEQVMAVGDQLNDLEMVAAVGHGVAMSNAARELHAFARYVAPTVHEEGLATIVEALVLARAGSARRTATSFLAQTVEVPRGVPGELPEPLAESA